MTIRLIIIAIIPSFVLLSAIYLIDKYDKEPVRLLIKLFIYGFLIAIPIILVENILQKFNIFIGIFAIIFEAYIVAGLSEEFFKRIIVLKVAFNNIAFNEKLDGIIYCVFASLGFATIENILYVVFQTASSPHIGIARALLSVPGHMLFAITMGYYLALSKFATTNTQKKAYMKKSLIYPIILHGTFNFILMINLNFLFIFIPYVIILWIINIKKLNTFYKLSKEANKIEQ